MKCAAAILWMLFLASAAFAEEPQLPLTFDSVVGRQDVPVDGEWHVLALDTDAIALRGPVNSIAVEVACPTEQPADAWHDDLRVADEPPDGALPRPKEPAQGEKWREDLDDASGWQAHRDWLANPAEKFEAAASNGILTLWVSEPGAGMKWSRVYPEGPDLSKFRYVTVRYRARGVAPHADYFVWFGSAAGGMPPQSLNVLGLVSLVPDGRWHVETAELDANFIRRQPAGQVARFRAREHWRNGAGAPTWERSYLLAEMALQVQAAEAAACVELDYLELSATRPRVPLADQLPYSVGWETAKLKPGEFASISLASIADTPDSVIRHDFGLSGWFSERRVTIYGIPFELISSGSDNSGSRPDLVSTPLEAVNPVVVPVGQEASEIYLLLAAPLPANEWTGVLGPRAFLLFDDPERFVAQVVYADGITDDQFPIRADSGRHEVVRGMDVYALTPLRPVPVQEVRLLDKMHNARFLLAALTVNSGPAATPLPAPFSLPTAAPAREIRPAEARIEQKGNVVRLANSFLRVAFDTAAGLRLRGLDCAYVGTQESRLEPDDLFRVRIGDREIGSGELRLVDVSTGTDGGRRTASFHLEGEGLTADLSASLDIGPELTLSLALRNDSGEPVRGTLTFPIIRHLRLGSVEDTWYLYNRHGTIIQNRPLAFREAYSSAHPLQFDDVFNPSLGGGIYVMGHDLADTYRWFSLAKDDLGVTLSTDYLEEEVAPGQCFQAAETVIGAHPGDWHEAFRAYQKWVASWYQPLVPRNQWFQDAYDYRQHFMGEVFDRQTQQYDMTKIVEADREVFGSLDYLHFGDWGASAQYGRVGDYNHYDEIGGREAFAGQIEALRQQDIPVGL